MNDCYMGVDPASFASESGRLRTFIGWSNPAVQPEDLAKAGFVYVANDSVQCVYCQGVLGSWEAGDVPLEEHRKFFPNCPLVASVTSQTQPPLLTRGIDVAGTGRPPKASTTKKKSVIINRNVIPHHASKHPEYGSLDTRVRSFDSWPVNVSLPQDAKCMAEAGLFYTGSKDFVRCFHCGQGLREWERNDDPWEEHARWHPTCELVLLKKGQIYVEKAKRKLSTSAENKGNDFHTGHHPNGETSRTADVNELLNEFMKIPESQIINMGIDRTEIERTLKDRQKNAHLPDIVLELIKNMKIKDRSEVPAASSDMGRFAEPRTNRAYRPVNTIPEVREKTFTCFCPIKLAQIGEGGTARAHILAEEAIQHELRSCIVCTVQERCITFLPCGHFSTCTDCTLLLSDCPVCRQQIDTVVKTYMS